MSRSELLSLMSGGMATIAGGVLAAYIGFLGGDDPETRLLFANILLRHQFYLPRRHSLAQKFYYPKQKTYKKLRKLTLKIWGQTLSMRFQTELQGIKLAVNVGAMLLVFIALVYGLNFMFVEGIGSLMGLNDWACNSSGGTYDAFSLQYTWG